MLIQTETQEFDDNFIFIYFLQDVLDSLFEEFCIEADSFHTSESFEYESVLGNRIAQLLF